MGRGPQAYPYGFWCFPVKCFPKKPEFPEFPVTPLFKGLPLMVVKPIEIFVFLVVDLTTPSEIALNYLHLPWETATCGCYTPFSFPKVAIPWAFFCETFNGRCRMRLETRHWWPFFCCEESPSLLRRTRKSFTKTWAIWRPQVLREVFFQTNHLLFGSWQVKVYGNPENPQLITKLHIKMVYSGPQLNLPLKWFWKIYINMSFWCSDFLRVESFQRTGPSLTRLTVVVRVTGVESPSR